MGLYRKQPGLAASSGQPTETATSLFLTSKSLPYRCKLRSHKAERDEGRPTRLAAAGPAVAPFSIAAQQQRSSSRSSALSKGNAHLAGEE